MTKINETFTSFYLVGSFLTGGLGCGFGIGTGVGGIGFGFGSSSSKCANSINISFVLIIFTGTNSWFELMIIVWLTCGCRGKRI